MTKLQQRRLKQLDILRAFVNKLSNETYQPSQSKSFIVFDCGHAYEAQQVMEQVRKLDKDLPDE